MVDRKAPRFCQLALAVLGVALDPHLLRRLLRLKVEGVPLLPPFSVLILNSPEDLWWGVSTFDVAFEDIDGVLLDTFWTFDSHVVGGD